MSVTDELERLKNLHDTQGISDSEYASAKQSVLNKTETSLPRPSQAARRPLRGRWVLTLLAVVAVIWLLVRFTAGQKNANTLFATAVRAPIQLDNEVQNLPASSWKSIPLNLTYPGTLALSITVVQGNPVDVFVTDTNGLAALQANRLQNVGSVNGFEATKTKSYRRSGELGRGIYYLVLRDTSLGILSARASDISVNAVLNP